MSRYRVSIHPYDGWFRKWEAKVALDIGPGPEDDPSYVLSARPAPTYFCDGRLWRIVAKFKSGPKSEALGRATDFVRGRIASEEREQKWQQERENAYADGFVLPRQTSGPSGPDGPDPRRIQGL